MDGTVEPTSPAPASTHYLVIHNDEVHSFNYVMQIASQELTADHLSAQGLTSLIDRTGAAAIGFHDLDLMERVRARIVAYGPDPLMPRSPGPLLVTVSKADELGEIAIFGHISWKEQLPAAVASRRIEDADRELSLLVTGVEDPEEGNYRVHQFAMGCALALLLAWLFIYGFCKIF